MPELDELLRDPGLRVLAGDLNHGFLAPAVLDRAGNAVIRLPHIPLVTEDLPASVRDGHLRQALTCALDLAEAHGCRLVVVENLGFSDMRARGRERYGSAEWFRKVVCGMPTAQVRDRLVAMAARRSVAVAGIPGAYSSISSIWGAEHWQAPLSTNLSTKQHEVSGHTAAAVVLGRRALGHSARRRPRASPGVTAPDQRIEAAAATWDYGCEAGEDRSCRPGGCDVLFATPPRNGNVAAMSDILQAAVAGASGDELASMEMPESYRAAFVRRDEAQMFAGLDSSEKDPRKSLHVGEVPLPELAPDEAYVAVMASAINFNTVWTSIFEPLPTFGFLDRLAKESVWGGRHALGYHVVGSDASGVVLRTGSLVRNWKPGDRVTIHCNYVDDQDPTAHDDSMLALNQRIWGFETNFGGLADVTVVKANQLMPKPAHLTWEEAAVNALCNSTAYRMLVSRNGAPVAQGDRVLVWGATGGLGSFAVQYVLNAGGIPVGVVSSPEKVELLRALGVDAAIDRSAAGYRFWKDEHTQDESEWRRLRTDIRALVGDDPEIVFEHPGRETMGASVFVCKRAGTIVTCAATTGYMIEYDNRHLWMRLKTIKGSHFANYREAWDANRQVCEGRILPPLSAVFGLPDVGEATFQVQRNLHEGKIGVLCLAPHEGLGIDDPELRERVGEDRITLFRRYDA